MIPVQEVPLSAPFYRSENQGTERLSSHSWRTVDAGAGRTCRDSPTSGRAGFQLPRSTHQRQFCSLFCPRSRGSPAGLGSSCPLMDTPCTGFLPFHSRSHAPHCRGVTSQIHRSHVNSCLRICFEENPHEAASDWDLHSVCLPGATLFTAACPSAPLPLKPYLEYTLHP